MSEQGSSSTDKQILAQQQALQQKVKRSVIIGASIIAVLLLAYLVKSFLTGDQTRVEVNNQSLGDEVRLTTDEIESYRDDFKQSLARFEQNQQLALEKIKSIGWQQTRVDALFSLKDKALSDFAKSSFRMANQTLSELSAEVDLLVTDWQIAYESKIQQTRELLQQSKINQARLAFAEAIAIMPENPDGQLLQQKLDNFETLAEVRQALNVARVENNLDKQIALLSRLVQLDNSLIDEQQLLKDLQQQKSNETHAQLILNANEALDNGNLKLSQQLLRQAKSLKPQNTSTLNLESRLQAFEQSNNLSNHLAEVDQLVSQQKWQAVLNKTNVYSAQYPGQEQFVQWQSQAQDIITLQKRIALFTRSPERLADDNLRKAAIDTLQKGLVLANSSQTLAIQLGDLATLIDKYSSPLEVTISSDNESYIVVLSVGHVGKVEQKQIALTPGNYTLEARRDGFQTKRLEIKVSSGQDNTFYLACDKRI